MQSFAELAPSDACTGVRWSGQPTHKNPPWNGVACGVVLQISCPI